MLTATGEPGYYLKGWYDANDILVSTDKNFQIVMDSNQVFSARFRIPEKIQVVGGGDAIVRAIDMAENGDTLVVEVGTYDGGINFGGKEVRLMSANPDDPAVVAQTIIDGQFTTRAVTFSGGEDAGTVFDGFTIVNAGAFGEPGGAIYVGPDSSPTIVNLDISNCSISGGNGGAIFVDVNSSPAFENILISSRLRVPQ